MASLIVTVGQNQGDYYKLGSRTMTLGRDPARDIQLIDERVGRKHFQIRKEGEEHKVLDLQSKNGLFVNGNKVEEHALKDGDEIQAGDTILTFYSSDTPDRTDALHKYKKLSRQTRDDQTIVD